MPSQVSKSPLLAKLGADFDAAVRWHAGDEIKTFNQGLPPGIRGGIAKLASIGINQILSGQKYAGNYRYEAVGVILEPDAVLVGDREEHVAGLQTRVFETLCDTSSDFGAKSKKEHIANLIQHVGKLGGRLAQGQGGQQLMAVIDQLGKSCVNGRPVYFHFTTSARDPDDPAKGVWENWNGTEGLEEYQEPDAAAAATDDQSGAGDQPSAVAGETAPEEEVDVDELAAEADGMDLQAALAPDGPGTKLLQVAEQFGADVDACKAANTWADAAAIITAAAGGGEVPAEETTPEPEPWKPAKGETCGYKAPVKNKAGKLVPGKVVQCEIDAINAKSGTADLHQLANKKVAYKGVRLDQLEQLS